MIILVTGVPGAGKTSFAVSELLRSEKRKLTYGCPVKGIEELKEPKFEDLKNCCILVDEAHMIFGTGQAEHVNFLTVHRHNNLDFILTTQDFSLLNRKILPLVGKHYHFSLTPLGERRMLTWDRYGNPRSKADVASALSKLVTVDRENWGNFDSVTNGAEMPEVRKSKKPAIFFVVAALFVALVAGIFYFGNFDTVSKYYYEHSVEFPQEKEEPRPPQQPEKTPELNLPAFTQAEMPEAKQEESVEDSIVGCVKSATTCTCYDEKARKVKVPLTTCTERFGA